MPRGRRPAFFLLLTCLLLSVVLSGSVRPAPLPASEPSYQFHIERDWLTMPDGVRLSVSYFKPTPREPGERFPVLFEYLPYRKDDFFYRRDYPLYSYYARRGYVVAKVDIRGTGSSEGHAPPREYSDEEMADALEIIAHLAAAPWSTGKVGMMGISWSGFNALQVAMRQPPALKAILAIHASDDLFHDDIHYVDGILHVNEYELNIDHDLGMPRWPDYALDEKYFEERFNNYPWLLTYLHQQRDGRFWREQSLMDQYQRIQVPAYLIGGLLDTYRDTVPRLLENLEVPVKAEMGPWVHAWPDNGTPGPNYEWRHEMVRWWDYWLKGRDTGIMEEPRFAVFVREGHPPDAQLAQTPGHWRFEAWPATRTSWLTFYPARNNRLAGQPEEEWIDTLKDLPGNGFAVGYYWGEPTGDMRPVDGAALVYDSGPLEEALEIVGFPAVRLKVAADAELAHWVARLEDVAPEGAVSLVTGAALNGSQRNSRLHPEPLVPGETTVIDFPLHFTTWTFQPGHRIRLAVTNSLFPMLWPAPARVTSQLHLGTADTRLRLPVMPPAERVVPAFLPPQPREERPDASFFGESGWPRVSRVTHDQEGKTTVEWQGETHYQLPGSRIHVYQEMVYGTNEENPADSFFENDTRTMIELKGRDLGMRTHVRIQSDHDTFHVRFVRQIMEGAALIRERVWEEDIPRDFQ